MKKNIHIIAIFILAFILYGNTLPHQFALDDYLMITGNRFTKKGLDGIADIWTNDAVIGTYGQVTEHSGGRYRPLPITMFAIEYELFGLKPFIGHFINVLLYAVTGILIYLLLLRLLPSRNPWIPLFVSVLFIIHPIHTEIGRASCRVRV